MLTRFDFYRIVVPGAVLLIVVVVSLRLISLTDGMHHPEAERLIAGAIRFLEDPFRGSAAAFSAGFALYLLDPAYSGPDYHSGLPSDHLRKRLDEEGVEVQPGKVLSIYFHLLNSKMPKDLQERSSLYASFLRISVAVSLAATLGGLLTPAAVILYGSNSRVGRLEGAFTVGWGARIVVLGVFGVLALLVLRGVTSRMSDGESLRSGWISSGLTLALGLTAWMLTLLPQPSIFPSSAGVFSRFVLCLFVGASGLVWATVRIRGPLIPWMKAMLGARQRYVPEHGLTKAETVMLDASIAFVALFGALASSSVASDGQVVLMLFFPIVSFVIAYTRKAERQQGGIYQNQRAWIDANWEEVAKIARSYESGSGL